MTQADAPLALLSAGGTGGHLFPAEALAHELMARGWRVHLATDARAEKYAGRFPAERMHVIRSATPSGKNPLKLVGTAWTMMRGCRQARALIRDLRPAVVVGFGGYPTVPPVLMASGIVPTLIHEQNAVMGRANDFLAGRVTRIAGGFLKPVGKHADKIVQTGNPVRPAVIDAAGQPYVAPGDSGPLRLVVFGGSQGARYFSQTVPDALSRLPEPMRARLQVTQQARPEDEAEARSAYADIGVDAEVSPFFNDLPSRMANAHLVISRSGASTVSEIAAIGRPSVLVPYPHALDHDQAANAQSLAADGGAIVHSQDALDADRLSALIADLFGDSARLSAMAQAARAVGRPDAAALLADLTASIASS